MARRNVSAKNNYGAIPSVVRFKGVKLKFDSKAEALEALRLAQLELDGVISELSLQPEFEILPSFTVATNKTKNGLSKQSSMKYTPDFAYRQGLEVVVLEVKGFATTAYKLRKKLFLYQMREFGVDVFIELIGKNRYEFRLKDEK